MNDLNNTKLFLALASTLKINEVATRVLNIQIFVVSICQNLFIFIWD